MYIIKVKNESGRSLGYADTKENKIVKRENATKFTTENSAIFAETSFNDKTEWKYWTEVLNISRLQFLDNVINDSI